MKKKSVKLPNNTKKAWNNIYNLWYGIRRDTVKKLHDEMPSMVEAVRKANMGLSCSELLKSMALGLRMTKICFELLYGTTHTDKCIQFQ